MKKTIFNYWYKKRTQLKCAKRAGKSITIKEFGLYFILNRFYQPPTLK